jgi:hypothetical protein
MRAAISNRAAAARHVTTGGAMRDAHFASKISGETADKQGFTLKMS